jgi:hypothetical protein
MQRSLPKDAESYRCRLAKMRLPKVCFVLNDCGVLTLLLTFLYTAPVDTLFRKAEAQPQQQNQNQQNQNQQRAQQNQKRVHKQYWVPKIPNQVNQNKQSNQPNASSGASSDEDASLDNSNIEEKANEDMFPSLFLQLCILLFIVLTATYINMGMPVLNHP